jgi:hypothetical protein
MPSMYERDMNAKMPTFVHDTTTLHVGMFYLLTYVRDPARRNHQVGFK